MEETPDGPLRTSSWVLPVLGLIALLFTLLNGVPWVGKGEFEIYMNGRNVQWASQYHINNQLEAKIDRLLVEHDLLDARLRDLEQGRRR